MLTSTQQFRLLTENRTANAYAVTAKRYTRTGLLTALGYATTLGTIPGHVPLGPINDSGRRKRGFEIQLIGVGSADQTVKARLHRLKLGLGPNGQVIDYDVAPVATLDGILGTLVGNAGGLVLDSEKLCDAQAVTLLTSATTPKGISASLRDIYAGGIEVVQSWEPANNTPAITFGVDWGDGDLLVEPIIGNATSVNAVVEVML